MPSFAESPTITGPHVVLRPLAATDADDFWADLHDPEALRLTGTHRTFTRAEIDRWCATRAGQTDRLDLVIVERATGGWAGELAITDWDPDNRSCSFRIALTGAARGRGLGTEATQLAVDHVFDRIDDPPVHRLALEVFDFNARAQRAYERVGFRREGLLRDALRWDDAFHDVIVMSILRSDRALRSDPVLRSDPSG